MVELARLEDEVRLKKIWKRCFGDPEKYIDMFFTHRYDPDNTLVFRDNGSPVSMLFLLDCSLSIKQKSEKAQYLYAACTLPEYRGCGIMSGLIDSAVRLGNNRGRYYTVLVPAGGSKKLFEFYKRNGFKSFFDQRIIRTENNKVNISKKPVDSANIDPADYYRARTTALSGINHIHWDQKAISYALREHYATGGKSLKLFTCGGGYALYYEKENEILVKELCAANINLKDVLEELKAGLQKQNYTIILPCGTDPRDYAFEDRPFGMIRACREEKAALLQNENGYLALALE